MSLVDLIRKNRNARPATSTLATVATHQEESKVTVARIATVAIANTKEEKTANNSEIEKIRQWLFSIDEPETDHYLVIDRCKSDPEALAYFLRHARGEFDSHTATDGRRTDDRVRCGGCLYLSNGYCQKYQVTNHGIKYKPEQSTPKRCSSFKPKITPIRTG